jgi:hypothetical protein
VHDDKDKKIGSATYLKKRNAQYISFKVRMTGTNCDLIEPMLDKTAQRITFINKDNNP